MTTTTMAATATMPMAKAAVRDGGDWLDAAPALPCWSTLPAPSPGLACIVIVPARNEAEHVSRALAALLAQVDAPRFEVLLLANNCDDDTAERARRVRCAASAGNAPAVHVAEARIDAPDAHIGFVRRELMNEAVRRLRRAGAADGFVASTDADSVVAPDWLAATARELARGADAVGGRIVVDSTPAPGAEALRLRRVDDLHRLLRCRVASLVDPDPVDPWPQHHQHFGASLAVRASTYRRVGGVPPVRWLEDDALVRAIERADGAVRRSPEVRVRTSARLDGRADVGLSWQLRQWSRHDGAEPLVESADDWVAACRARRALRDQWRNTPPPRARSDTIPADTFGAAWEAIDAARLDALAAAGRLVPRSVAIGGLRCRARELAAGQRRANTSSR